MVENEIDGKAYAGDVSPAQAWAMLAGESDAVLVDVRSKAEWTFVGVPDLSKLGKRPLLIAWQTWQAAGEMAPNGEFGGQMAAARIPLDAPVLFLCRSGGRSRSAAIAMTRAGYRRAYNISGGFEGSHDSDRHRGRTDGWKVSGLPWVQE
jgi:rhodanese-related sulfurtransferase